jgi:hypothetical protein
LNPLNLANQNAPKLQEQGIIDSHGQRIRTDLPADMQPGKDHDFGG